MTINENDIDVAMEECSEIIQILSKSMRFGFNNHHPEKPEETNAKALVKEYYQLQAVMERIFKTHNITVTVEEITAIKQNKLDMVDKYANVSIKEGRITE